MTKRVTILGIKIDLDKNVEEIILGDNTEEIDAIEWMTSHHLSSKNLTSGEKLALMDALKEEIRRDNERRKLEGNSKGGKSSKEVSLQLECDLKNNTPKIHSETWTDSQTAKSRCIY